MHVRVCVCICARVHTRVCVSSWRVMGVDTTPRVCGRVRNFRLQDIEASIAKRQKRLDEMEANKKWNVDNMCHVVEERTIVSNKSDTTKVHFERREGGRGKGRKGGQGVVCVRM